MYNVADNFPPIVANDSEFSVTVRRNCSLSPRALLLLLAATAFVSFAIGVGFALVGAWLILPFAGLEIAALAAAFFVNGRHAGDYERITVQDGKLQVEVRVAEATHTHEFNAAWTRLCVDRAGGMPRLFLRSNGREIEIARHLTGAARRFLARELAPRLGRVQQ